MGSIQGGTMILGVPGNRGAFLFPRRAHLLTTCKAGGGIPPVGRARALFTNCLSDSSPEGAGNVASEHSLCSRLYICSISKTMRWHIATPSRRLPTKTLHRTILRICPGSVIAVIGMSCFPTHLFSLLEKRNRKMKGR